MDLCDLTSPRDFPFQWSLGELSPSTFKVERLWGYRSPWLMAYGEPILGGGKTPKVFDWVVREVEGLKF